MESKLPHISKGGITSKGGAISKGENVPKGGAIPKDGYISKGDTNAYTRYVSTSNGNITSGYIPNSVTPAIITGVTTY